MLKIVKGEFFGEDKYVAHFGPIHFSKYLRGKEYDVEQSMEDYYERSFDGSLTNEAKVAAKNDFLKWEILTNILYMRGFRNMKCHILNNCGVVFIVSK